MSAHQHYIKNAVKKDLPALRKHLDACLKARKDDEIEPVYLDIRQKTEICDHTPTLIHRIYVQTDDASALSSVGWVVNDGLNFCLDCLKEFSFFNRRHHCRACGVMVCHECCARLALIRGFEDLGEQRVCNQCNPKVFTSIRCQLSIPVLFSCFNSCNLLYFHVIQFSKVVPLVNNMSWGESVLTPVEARGPKSVEAQVPSTKAREITEAEQKRIDFNNRCELLQSDLRAAEQSVAAAPATVTLIPFPGFVIKTTRPSDFESKVFINVFHHTRVVDERMMLTYVPPFTAEELAAGGMVDAFNDDNDNRSSSNNTQQQQENRSPNSVASAGRTAKGAPAPAPASAPGPHPQPPLTTAPLPSVIRMEPLIYVSEATSTSDKDGFVWRLYNVLVSSSYLSREVVSAQAVHITDRTSVNRVSRAVRRGTA
jgi:hypothetical protein